MRARSLKPSLFKNEILGTADPLYTVIFEGLWCAADREGRLEDRPLRLHVEINPYRDSASTVQALCWLVTHGFVTRYEVEGQKYLQIVAFAKHQQPHVKEAKSRIPAPPNQGDVVAPGEPGASPVQKHLTPSSLTPDSGLPIPEDLHTGGAVAAPRETESAIWEHVATMKAKYPKGQREDWITAEKAARQLVVDGQATWPDLVDAVERYAKLCKATARIPLNPARFFTAIDRPWSQPWEIPAPKASGAPAPLRSKTAAQLEAEASARGEHALR